MKKLDKKAFWIVLAGIAASVVYRFVDLFISRNREFPFLRGGGFELTEEAIERLRKFIFGANAFVAVITALICAYFIYRLLKNRTQPAKQGYITFLLVVSIIFAVFNLLSVLMGSYITLINLAFNAAIIVGCAIQKNYEPPREYLDAA